MKIENNLMPSTFVLNKENLLAKIKKTCPHDFKKLNNFINVVNVTYQQMPDSIKNLTSKVSKKIMPAFLNFLNPF